MNNWNAVAEVMERSQSTGVARLVLIAIAGHMNYTTGDCYPGRHTIARLANCHPDSVRKKVDELVKLGELEVEVQGGPGTSKMNRPNLYRIPLLSRGVARSPKVVVNTLERGVDPTPEVGIARNVIKDDGVSRSISKTEREGTTYNSGDDRTPHGAGETGRDAACNGQVGVQRTGSHPEAERWYGDPDSQPPDAEPEAEGLTATIAVDGRLGGVRP